MRKDFDFSPQNFTLVDNLLSLLPNKSTERLTCMKDKKYSFQFKIELTE